MKSFGILEKNVGSWFFNAGYDLGHWQFGPVVYWRYGYRILILSLGPLFASIEWYEDKK